MSQVNTQQITVECACGKRLKAPASAVGKRAKCPKCGNVIRIEAPPPLDEGELGLDALYDLAEKEAQVAAAQESSSPTMRCPTCGTGTAPGAVLCVNCGYDFRTRTKVRAKSAAAAPPPPPAAKAGAGAWFKSSARPDKQEEADAPAAQGSFIMGLVYGIAFSVAGALACFLVWYHLPDIPFTGWLVLLVGFLAGLGVNIGYKAGTHFAGAVAAGITFIAVLVTKFVVLAAMVAPAVKEVAEEIKFTRDHRVLDMVENEEYKKANIDPDDASDEQATRIRADARKRVMDMPQDQYLKLVAKADMDELKRELIPYLTEDILVNERQITTARPTDDSYKFAREEATKRIEAMKPAERKQKLADYKKKTEAELEEEEREWREEMARARAERDAEAAQATRADADDDGGGGGLLGFFIIGALALFIWAMLPTFVAMALAWKVAADA